MRSLLPSLACLFHAVAVLMGPLSSHSYGQSSGPPLPSWLEGKHSLLPDISNEQIEEMRQLWAQLRNFAPRPDTSEPYAPEYVKAVQRVVELGPKAGLALVWMSIEEGPDTTYPPEFRYQARENALRKAAEDPDLAAWLKPLMEARMQWIRRELKKGALDETGVTGHEIGAMEFLFTYQGDQKQLENIHDLETEIKNSSSKLSGAFPELPDKEKFIRDQLARRKAYAQYHIRPFLQPYLRAQQIMKSGKSRAQFIKDEAADRREPKPPPLQKPSKIDESPSTAGTDQSWWALSLLALAAITLLWLWLRKRAKP